MVAINEKIIECVTDGIRATCREQTCMQGKVMEKSWINSLGFMELVVHGKTIQALVDTGATHNFMMKRLAREVGRMIFQ